MSRYRKISTRIWNDSKFASMSDDGKLAFFFVLTHPNMTSLGAMRATVEGLAAELGWPSERLSKAFREHVEDGVLAVDEVARCVFLPNFIKHNLPESPNVIKAWEKAAEEIPEGRLKALSIKAAIDAAKGMSKPFNDAIESLSEGFRKSIANQEQEQEQEQDIKNLRQLDEPVDQPAAKKLPGCPYDRILEAYREILPELPQPKMLNESRKTAIAARWREMAVLKGWTSADDGVAWFREFFNYVSKSDFLMGRTPRGKGHESFVVGIDWLFNSTNFLKTCEGNFVPLDAA